MEEAARVPVQPVTPVLVLVAVFQEAQTESSFLPLPRGSTFCSAARGVAAAKPKREGRMMVERMAMRTCEGLSGRVRLLEAVFVLTVYFLWYRRSKARGVRDLEAVYCVMSKIEKERGLVGPSYTTHAPCSTVDTRARLPFSRGDSSLAKSRWSRGHVLEKLKES